MATRVVYERPDGRWGWQLKADHGLIIATDGTTGYESEQDALVMADRVIDGEFRNAKKYLSSRTATFYTCPTPRVVAFVSSVRRWKGQLLRYFSKSTAPAVVVPSTASSVSTAESTATSATRATTG
jgi:uncharacterized protein YegP (UPF0339 family)